MDAPFDQMTLAIGERALSSDINRAQSQIYRSMRFIVEHMLAQRVSDASPAAQFRTSFLGNSFRVFAVNPAAMQVTVAPGLGFFYNAVDVPTNIGAGGTPNYAEIDDLSPVKPLPMVSPVTFAVATAPVGPNTRIDIIEVKYDRQQADPDSRSVWDDGAEAFIPNTVDKTLQFALDGDVAIVSDPSNSTRGLSYKIGTAGNPGVAPSVSPGYVKIAEVLVGSGVVTITDQNIIDRRAIAAPGGMVRVSGAWRLQWNGGTPIVTLRGIQAPPGIQVTLAVDSAPQKARFQIYVLGGQIAEGTAVCQALIEGGAGATEFVTVSNDTVVPVVEALPNSTIQGRLAAGTPTINAAIGAQILAAVYQVAYQTGATTNITSAKLEDLEIEFQATLAY